jgi:MoaA/NifB/PqqE/SkfB family radical SAM enzyme
MVLDIDQKAQECYQSAVTAWAKGVTRMDNPPWLAYIAVTNICNNRCGVCAIHKSMRYDRGVMSLDTFSRIIDELPFGVKKVYLFKQGEPFINENLELFVELLRERRPDIHIAIHTNGILAKRERVKKILPMVDSLGISISATTPGIYRKVHNTDNFNQIMENIRDISDILGQMPASGRPHVFIDYIRQEANKGLAEVEVVEFFKSRFSHLASVDFHWVYNFQGEIEEGNMEIYDKVEHNLFPTCVFPWSSITFCYEGKISYCFVEPREGRFLGDILKQSFEEVWNGEEYLRFRLRMANKSFAELASEGFHCDKCAWLWSMKCQSPKNLVGGYATWISKGTNSMQFGDILDMPQDQVFDLGTDYYLKGEILQALGCFTLVVTTGEDKRVLQPAHSMLENCRTVLKKYEHLGFWQEMLKKEGIHPEKKQCRYYPMGE